MSKRKSEDNVLQLLGGNAPSLMDRHLAYNLIMDQNRRVMTEHAMVNTALLYDLAMEIAANNPATSEDLRIIMDAYIGSTAEHIWSYGNPHSKKGGK